MVASHYEVQHECETQASDGFQILSGCAEGLSAGTSFAIAFGVLAALAVGGLFLWRWLQTRDLD